MSRSQISIYLAGNIQKGHEDKSKVYWTPDDQAFLADHLQPHTISFLNPASRSDDLSGQKSVFGRDMTQVSFADVILVDARERRGLGVGAEMMWAKVNQIPLITLAPKNTHYQKDAVDMLGVHLTNWTHPFVESLSDLVANDLQDVTNWLKAFIQGQVHVKGPSFIKEAMHYYQQTQLPVDQPMQDLLAANDQLKQRITNFMETK